jgi:two-component system phosphate regulon sensor histidine kinase PhoR
VLLLHPIHGRLVLGAHRGLPPATLATHPDTLFSGTAYEEVISYGHPVVRPLFEDSHEGVLMAAGMASCAYLPLLAGGTVVGVLTLYGDAALPKNLDTSTLMPLCNQIGFAVANVQMYDDSQIKRRRLNTIMNSIAEGVLLCDRDGNLVLGNEAALYLLRLDSFPYGQPLSDWPTMYQLRDLDGENLPLERLPLLRALAGEVFDDDRVLLNGASGPDTVMSFSGAPAYADDGSIEGAVVILRDFTTKQKRERAKDEFLATAAHELRSPLAAVRSYADLLLRREQQREGDPRDLQGLTILSQQVTHMLRMVDNLLDLSRLDAGQIDLQPQRINLVSLATQVLDQQRPAAASIELALDSDEPELWLHGDPLRIRQVLTNLVGNAIKHSPADGHICVRLERVERTTVNATDAQPLENDDSDDGTAGSRQAMVLVAVRDSGHGIPADQHALLFQRFFRARGRRTDGLGLGLYLSRQFVLMHGGSIWLESSEGKGSTFYFTLPVER